MNKTELINAISEKSGLSKNEAASALGATIEVITETLVAGNKVSLIGFGTFDTKQREARTLTNPFTKEKYECAATRVPVFKFSKAIRDIINK